VIVHAHIRGHYRCVHFGDVPLFDLDGLSGIVGVGGRLPE
jgi:hypothetical protein